MTMQEYYVARLRPRDPSIIPPPVNDSFQIDPALIQMIKDSYQLSGLLTENPVDHLRSFTELCDACKPRALTYEGIRLRLFRFSLRDRAVVWLDSLPSGSITTWDQCETVFLKRFIPPTRLHKDLISHFKQRDDETLQEAWKRFNASFRMCPDHWLDQMSMFEYLLDRVNVSSPNPAARRTQPQQEVWSSHSDDSGWRNQPNFSFANSQNAYHRPSPVFHPQQQELNPFTYELLASLANRMEEVSISQPNDYWAEQARNALLNSEANAKDPKLCGGLEMGEAMEKGAGPRKFPYGELARATNNFSQGDNKLWEEVFGRVYRGLLPDGRWVAVKWFSKRYSQGVKEFIAKEVEIIGELRHKNLVQLIGWCYDEEDLLLVYEFHPNGSLDSNLFGQKNQSLLLTWDMRYKIAEGLASGLLYLHEERELYVAHGDIKSSNIMLDYDFNAKIGDVGVVRLVDHDKGSQTSQLAGTIEVGSVAPDCAITAKASRELTSTALELCFWKLLLGKGLQTSSMQCIWFSWFGTYMELGGYFRRVPITD